MSWISGILIQPVVQNKKKLECALVMQLHKVGRVVGVGFVVGRIYSFIDGRTPLLKLRIIDWACGRDISLQ